MIPDGALYVNEDGTLLKRVAGHWASYVDTLSPQFGINGYGWVHGEPKLILRVYSRASHRLI